MGDYGGPLLRTYQRQPRSRLPPTCAASKVARGQQVGQMGLCGMLQPRRLAELDNYHCTAAPAVDCACQGKPLKHLKQKWMAFEACLTVAALAGAIQKRFSFLTVMLEVHCQGIDNLPCQDLNQ